MMINDHPHWRYIFSPWAIDQQAKFFWKLLLRHTQSLESEAKHLNSSSLKTMMGSVPTKAQGLKKCFASCWGNTLPEQKPLSIRRQAETKDRQILSIYQRGFHLHFRPGTGWSRPQWGSAYLPGLLQSEKNERMKTKQKKKAPDNKLNHLLAFQAQVSLDMRDFLVKFLQKG